MCIYIYIYIYEYVWREREREREISLSLYIYIYIYIYTHMLIIQRGEDTVGNPSSSSNLSIRAFRVVSCIELRQTILYRAIRVNSISINCILSPILAIPIACYNGGGFVGEQTPWTFGTSRVCFSNTSILYNIASQLEMSVCFPGEAPTNLDECV